MEFQIKTTVIGVDQDGRETTKHLLERLKPKKLIAPNIEQDVELFYCLGNPNKNGTNCITTSEDRLAVSYETKVNIVFHVIQK